MNKLIAKVEDMDLSFREQVLFGLVLFLGGLLIGILFSPKGDRIYGSNNGNNNTDCLQDNDEYDDEVC